MIHDSIVKHAFVADPQNPQMTVTRYIRPFYAIGFAVMYEHETGFMYCVQFNDEGELLEYINGGFILSLTRSIGFFSDAIRYRQRIEFLPALNRDRVNTERQFIAAFAIAEHAFAAAMFHLKNGVKTQ